MKNIKQQFSEFRQNTPRHVQWLLLGAAFVIVIILLTLLLTHKSKNTEKFEQVDASLQYSPQSITFKDVFVGERETEIIDVSANRNIFVESIDIDSKEDFSVNSDCEEELDKSCTIYVNYKPTNAQKQTKTEIVVNWHLVNQDEIPRTAKILVTYSAKEKAEEKPVEKPKPEPEPVFEDEPEPIIEPEPEYDDTEDFEDIIVDNPFEEPEPKPMLAPEKCSEFAIPGYDTSGRQIGWIKPTGGANYFHPFSDKDCSNPTGKYDFETGIITSLKDGSKIGTDSDHIGYRNVRSRNLSVPQLSSPQKNIARATKPQKNIARATNGEFDDNAVWGPTDKDKNPLNLSDDVYYNPEKHKTFDITKKNEIKAETLIGSATGDERVASSRPYDRTFILRQFKPIPATIVSEVRADPSVYGCNKAGTKCDGENHSVPVRATVDRNVFSDDGRTIIIPTGTLLMGYLSGELPGPYQSFGRMNIKWYQFIRPDGVEFNFGEGQDPYSGDAQGRMGVPGHGSTDYVEQMVMPVITALVPAAVNMIAPITDTVINQIDLDNNTIVQSGTIRSSEMAKQDIINTWNKITQKLIVDAIDNTVPPFSIAAGTRINVFSPVDLIVSCQDAKDKKCSVIEYGKNDRRPWNKLKDEAKFVDSEDPSWKGQIRSFDLSKYCEYDGKKVTIKDGSDWAKSGYDYRTVLAYCEAQNYQAINNAKQQAYNKQVQDQADKKKQEYGATWNAQDGWTTNFTDTEAEQKYNTEVLGLTYDEDGNIVNPFGKNAGATNIIDEGLTCGDGLAPDLNGCCAGETFTDMGEDGWNCCPDAGGDCFPPIEVE